jgi:integrase
MTDDEAWKKVGKLGLDKLVDRPDPESCTFGHIMQAWLAYGRTKAGKPRAHTTKNTDKRNCQKHLSYWSSRIAIEMQPDEVQEWINQQSVGLQDKLCRTMSAIFRHGQKYGLIPRTPESNPMLWVSASSETGYEAVAPDAAECKAILDKLEDPLVRTLVILVAVTALRIGECLGLKWDDVDWKKGRIYVRRDWADGEFGDPKSKASKSPVEMHETLATLLLEWRKISIYTKDSDYIFPSYKLKGKQPRLGSMIATDYVRPAAVAAKVIDDSCPRFGLHNLRHGSATWLAENGTDPIVIQRMLRWSSVTMLQRYAHVSKKARQAQGEFLEQFKPGRVQPRVQ